MCRRILVPVNGGMPSRLALQHAMALGQSVEAELRLVHALAWPWLSLDLEDSPELVYASLTRAGQNILEQAIDRARRSGVRASATLLDISGGGVSRAIVEEATRWPAELIVMGTRARRGLTKLLGGSVTERVIRAAPVPVLVIPAGARAEPLDLSPLGTRSRSGPEPEATHSRLPPCAA